MEYQPLEIPIKPDELEKCNKAIFELEFSCDATIYDVYCPPDRLDSPLAVILQGIFSKRKRPNRMQFKSKVILTIEGVETSTEFEVGRQVKSALVKMKEHIKEYENCGNPPIIY